MEDINNPREFLAEKKRHSGEIIIFEIPRGHNNFPLKLVERHDYNIVLARLAEKECEARFYREENIRLKDFEFKYKSCSK